LRRLIPMDILPASATICWSEAPSRRHELLVNYDTCSWRDLVTYVSESARRDGVECSVAICQSLDNASATGARRIT
jgi:hypothetical protein